MRDCIFFILLWLLVNLSTQAQTLGEAVHPSFGKTKQMIVDAQGTDFSTGVTKAGTPFIGYQRIFDQNGKDVAGFGIYHFENNKVIQYTTVIGPENLNFWINEFSKKLIRRDEDYWVEPAYDLVWNLKVSDNRLFITAFDNNVVRAKSPDSFGRNWTKEVEAEFMKNCVYGNPNNVGKEATIQPVCQCVIGKVKRMFPDVSALAKFTAEDMIKLAKACVK